MISKIFLIKRLSMVTAVAALLIAGLLSNAFFPNPLAQTFKESSPQDNHDALPNWDIEHLQNTAIKLLPKHESKSMVTRLLVWHTEEFQGGDKPFHVNSALLWVKFTSLSGNHQWGLMDLYLHPGSHTWLTDEGLDPKWRPIRFFDHPPNNREVYDFLKHWHFNPTDSKIVVGAVRERTWTAVIGESPTKFYSRLH